MSKKFKSKTNFAIMRKRLWSPSMMLGAFVATAGLLTLPITPLISAEQAEIVVYKTLACGCCKKWVEHLRKTGLEVKVVNVSNTQPAQSRVGVPRELGSCHTAVVGNYWVEGHVPADLVIKLMTEKPKNIRGIAVPGMPAGSPGMESPNPVRYNVLAYDIDGNTTVYAKR